ncbi:MAG: trypsin-like peptidase domain-containing protein, partial [Proteobacteria bacterium]|nr:trypsin-like peptidase domain-containing protein [Pseudomonadota bacterium]
MKSKNIKEATVKISTTTGFKGSGFFVTSNGYILTAWHCISENITFSTAIIIETTDGKIFENVYLDKEKSLSDYDIAVLKIEYTTENYVSLGLTNKKYQDNEVIAIGYPAGYIEGRGIGIYKGIINQLLKLPKTKIEAFETNAIEGQGQSGGMIYHVITERVIGLATDIYDNDITKTTGIAVCFDKLFQHWPEIIPLSERLTRFMQQIESRKKDIRSIWKQVNKYLRNLKTIGIDEEAQDMLSDIQDFLANEMTPQEFIDCWQQENEQSINYDTLAESLKDSEIAIFLGSNIPEQITPQLANSFNNIKGCFSEICEYVELNTNYNRNKLRN